MWSSTETCHRTPARSSRILGSQSHKSRYDAESLEMIQPKTIDKVIRQDTIDNPVCLLIVQNCLSEPILDGLFANKKKFMEFASAYEMRIRKNDLDGTTTL